MKAETALGLILMFELHSPPAFFSANWAKYLQFGAVGLRFQPFANPPFKYLAIGISQSKDEIFVNKLFANNPSPPMVQRFFCNLVAP